RTGRVRCAVIARRRRYGALPRSARPDGRAIAPHLPGADALLQDRRRVHGVAQWPAGSFRDDRRPAIGAKPAAPVRAVPLRGSGRPALRSRSRLCADAALSGDTGRRRGVRFAAIAHRFDPLEWLAASLTLIEPDPTHARPRSRPTFA